ncbi:uncharacterized protein DUF1552 [Roseimicrobium gellanilyticum]|uniref:Uncharacterized protein DUF1552 n=1 Tax=Roseimicrobium gellanilyticum TaxID=748857 RepID=A0A366HNS9_9BACT|nr:DUF1552 domain-containing protein [Roseimicrobium gellanilyticum]RBP43635.1 uncharacterized protein DUF1552 [Roseimicrobium gellanilyticum]
MHTPSTRRHFLRSSTALIALPVLESLGFRRFASAAAPAAAPKRLVFLGFGWGITDETWFPKISEPGSGYTLPPGLQPLARHKADFSIVQGLWNKYSSDGHWGSTMWLTGANRYAQPGQTFHNSISADQVAAAKFGLHTRFSSLQLNAAEESDRSGHGPGLSLAWDVSGKPIGGQKGPLEAYHRLFSRDNTPIEQKKAMLAQKRSVLDAVLENANTLKRGLGKNDNAKLEEYFQGIRDIETRLSKDEQWLEVPPATAPLPEPKPGLAGREEIRLMYDIMVAAMQTDSTRVLTYRQPVSTLLTSMDIKVAPHDMSHYHSTMGEKLDASQRRDLAQSELLAGFIDKLKATKEADGSRLFDNVAVAYGSNIRTEHSLDNCPTLLTGGGAGIKLGHNIVVSKDTPLCNAWLTLLHGLGIEAERHGDSSGVIKEMAA